MRLNGIVINNNILIKIGDEGIYLSIIQVFDLYNFIIMGFSLFMMLKVIFMLQMFELVSSFYEVVGRFGEWYVSDCICCELLKCDFVVFDDVGMIVIVYIICWGWGVIVLSDFNFNVY